VENTLFYGDNLEVLRLHIKDESVDLIYLDPPFNSNATYCLSTSSIKRKSAQIKAFNDMWRWDEVSAKTYQEVVESGGKVAEAMRAFRQLLGDNDMLAYLSMMALRLVELRRVLKPTGSIYLHCDPTASHYLKVLMDAIYGARHFRNEIVWHYQTGGASDSHLSRKHDIILLYAKGTDCYFDPWASPDRRTEKALQRAKNPKGARIQVDSIFKLPMDVWIIQALNPMEKERLGYPTQKPERLLERIIRLSCPENGIILDPFCGCGTAVAVAQRLNRQWIGIDITHLAITLIKHRLNDAFGSDAKYNVVGVLPDAGPGGLLCDDQ
tara:strand:+ start:1844 stop:2815 length:972 start_codon:yes stop_codon:yes gene_type:complete